MKLLDVTDVFHNTFPTEIVFVAFLIIDGHAIIMNMFLLVIGYFLNSVFGIQFLKSVNKYN